MKMTPGASSGGVRTWRVIVAGTIQEVRGSERAMKAYVEGQAPLKQGWHGAWHRDGHNGWSYRRQNGKGRSVPGIVMVEPLLVAQHPTQVVRLRHDGTIIVRKDR